MNININQGNTQENITSEIILKLYQIATAAGNSVTLSGNLYSPSGYVNQVNYLNTQFAPNLTITVPDSGKYIYFEDTAVQSALLNAGIGDGVGITIPMASTATLTSNVFSNNTNIVTFNEFGRFTRANTNPPNYMFKGCVNLTSIDLSGCTSISNHMFDGCNNLILDASKDLTNVTYIGESAFNGCTLEGDVLKAPINRFHNKFLVGFINAGVTTIDFSDGRLTNLSSWVDRVNEFNVFKFPKTLVSSDGTFQIFNNNAKQFFYGLDNITSLKDTVFLNVNVQNPIGLLQYEGPHNIIANRGNWKEVTTFHSLFFPKMKTTKSFSEIGNYGPQKGFFANGAWDAIRTIGDLVYFKDITSFGLGTFWKTTITNLVINNTTVPTYDTTNLSIFDGKNYQADFSNLFGDATITTVWVPESAVSDYQNSPLFSGMTVKSIDLKTNGVDYDLPRFATYADWEAAYNASVANGTESPVGLIEEYM